MNPKKKVTVPAIRAMKGKARIGMLTSMTADGRHVSRPMAVQEAEFDGDDLWVLDKSNQAAKLPEHPDDEKPRERLPEKDLLFYIMKNSPSLAPWQRDAIAMVHEEMEYFVPQMQTKIMNEGWASYWHARLLREADFIPQHAYLDAIKCHSDVVRPIAARAAPAIRPADRLPGALPWTRARCGPPGSRCRRTRRAGSWRCGRRCAR